MERYHGALSWSVIMKRGDYVEILLGADVGKIAKVERVDGYRIVTQVEQQPLDHYRLKDLRVLTEAEAKTYEAQHKTATD